MRRISIAIAALLAIGLSGCSTGSGNATAEAQSCASGYSLEGLKERAFAFDGTVVEITEEIDPKLPDDVSGGRRQHRARFEVSEWFAGGSASQVWVWMQRNVGLGERLLVSGEPRWGGSPLDDAIQWECGWTIQYSDVDAEAWRDATAS